MKVKTKIIDKGLHTPALGYAKTGDAGIDLTATSKTFDERGNAVYGTNRAFEIPKGYVGLLFPRSSNAKKDLLLSNSVGVLDSGYRGEVLFKFKVASAAEKTIKVIEAVVNHKLTGCSFVSSLTGIAAETYEVGDRIGQLIILPYPEIEFEEVDDLTETERGEGSYGSTGN